jgi:hypothetical protein
VIKSLSVRLLPADEELGLDSSFQGERKGRSRGIFKFLFQFSPVNFETKITYMSASEKVLQASDEVLQALEEVLQASEEVLQASEEVLQALGNV